MPSPLCPAGKTSNKWRDMIKVRAPPGGGGGGKKSAPSLRDWAAKLRVPLVDPDVEAAIAAAHIPYDDERVPYEGLGPGPAPVEEGWVAVDDPAGGGFAIAYVFPGPQVRGRRGRCGVWLEVAA
jgi:hypothetical protein